MEPSELACPGPAGFVTPACARTRGSRHVGPTPAAIQSKPRSWGCAIGVGQVCGKASRYPSRTCGAVAPEPVGSIVDPGSAPVHLTRGGEAFMAPPSVQRQLPYRPGYSARLNRRKQFSGHGLRQLSRKLFRLAKRAKPCRSYSRRVAHISCKLAANRQSSPAARENLRGVCGSAMTRMATTCCGIACSAGRS